MLPVSLDCPFSLLLRYSLTFICPVSCVPYVASFSGLSFFLLPKTQDKYMLENTEGVIKKDNQEKLVTLGTQDTGQINVREYRRGNKKGQSRETGNIGYTRHRTYYVASFSGLSIFITSSVFSNIYLSCVLCTLCCQFLWIVLFLLPLRYSLTCICPVSCVPYEKLAT
jgi:hypothetical protein